MHIYMHTSIIQTYIHVYTHTSYIRTYIRTYIHVCLHTYIHSHIIHSFIHSVEPKVCQNDSRMLSRKYKNIEIMHRIQKYCSTKCYKHLIYSIINHLYTQRVKNGKKVFLFFRSNFIASALGKIIFLSLSLCFVAFRDVTTSLKHTAFVTAQEPGFPSQHCAMLG
jgi:hypothetical protein